jgi:hypothetical protein
MKTGKAIQAQKTKYPVVAAVALIAALVLGTFVSAQPVAARGAGGIQHGINIELPSNPELMSARSHYSAVASSAAYSELARLSAEYGVSSAGYTAVSKFYVERLRAEIGRSAGLASNPELMVARSLYSQPSVACSISDSELAASPELVFFQQASGC